MTQQSISASLGMNNGSRVTAGGGKGQFSGQNSRQNGMVEDPDDGDFTEQASGSSDKASKDSDKADAKKDGPDFDALLRALKGKGQKEAGGKDQTSSPDAMNDGSDATGQNGAGVSSDSLLAKLFEGLSSADAKAAADAQQGAQGKAGAAAEDALSNVMSANQLSGKTGAQAAGSDQSASKATMALLFDQKSNASQMPGTVANGETVNAKPGLFDAYSVETKSVSAFDKIVPVVKEAVLSPSQKALRDGFTVMRQETHFAPTASVDASNMATTNAIFQQISTAIANDLSPSTLAKGEASASSSNAAQQSASGGFRMASGGDALRVLDIQLHPADLGKVRLSIRLNETSVDVRVEVTNASTAKVLEGNKQMLDMLLNRAGYRADHISIVAIDDKSGAQITPPSPNNNAQNQPNQQGQQGQSGAFAGEGGNAQQDSGDQQQPSGHEDPYSGAAVDASHSASDEAHNDQDTTRHAKGITL
ncbi:hook-length control protein FliK [Cohaesibacter sp. ES.047]|uniref:flagellar hook-length control protein FliK n=1 Tax=Cohaesibacter sp. ES.047 TaxID=1798205 RepID=UPI000BB8EA6E|nr:flagellar hook-length control protein FliK [Cohaesibacter sp. ES.047]SNY92152.1 hook-length control protein FliK [Cohaesibacter sp. ES.047]